MRLWVVPRISDYSQNLFHLDIENCASVNIPSRQIQAFATKPLAPMKLENFVQELSRAQLGQPPVSGGLPFSLGSERATQTHCSQATMNRITTDVIKYAQKTNAENTAVLLGFMPREIDSFHDSPAALSKATDQLSKLIKSLNSAMDFDRKSLWNLMNRALAIATSDERSDTPNAGGPNGECNSSDSGLGNAVSESLRCGLSFWFRQFFLPLQSMIFVRLTHTCQLLRTRLS
jgi:hypothetical protein